MTNTPKSLLDYMHVMVGVWRDDHRDDAQLLDRFVVAHDERAFTTLLWRHGPLVWRTCTRVLGDGTDAEDAFQTTFLALARKAGQLRGDTLAGWLHRVARQAALDIEVKSRKRRDFEHHLRTITQRTSEEDASRTNLYAALDEELVALPERLRIPLVLRYLEGKTLEDVARIVGCSRRDLGRRLERGEAILRQRLERRGLEVFGMAALLTSSVTVSAMPAGLVGSTARAAVVFRSGVLTGGATEAARAVVRASPIEGMMMRKSWWIALACVGALGAGLAAWQVSAGHSDGVESAAPASPRVLAERGNGQVDHYGDPLPSGALARLGTLRLRHVGSYFNYKGAASVVFSRDSKVLLTAGPGNPIRLWDAATGNLLRSFGDGRKNSAPSIALSPDGRTLAARPENCSDGSVSLWEIATGKLLRQLPKADIRALAFSRDGRTLLSIGEDDHLHVWEIVTGKEVRDQPLLNAEKAGRPSTTIFSPDGKTLASIHEVNNNKIVYLWEAATGKELRHLSLGKGMISPGAVAFSSDSHFLAVSSFTMLADDPSDGTVHLWEVATGKEVRKWTTDKTGTCSVAFSPDGKLLATGSGFGPIRLWEVATSKELRRCRGYRAHVVALAFSPDGSTLASLAGLHDHTARLWEVASGKERLPLSRGHAGPVLSVAFSLDGKDLISAGGDGLIGFWNAETGQEQRPPLRAGDFQAVAVLSADGKTVLSVGNNLSPNIQDLFSVLYQAPTQVCVWDRATGQKLRQFEGPATGVAQSLRLSPDGKTLVLTSWRNVHLIEVATGKVMHTITDTWGNPPNKCAALSPDGKALAVFLNYEAEIGIVQFYETATGKNLGSIKAHQNMICCLAFSPDGRTLAAGGVDKLPKGGESYTIRLWRLRADKKEWKEAGTLVGHQGIVWGLTFSPDGKTLASTSHDGTARLWEVATGQERRRFAGHGGEVWCVAFAPDGRRLAAGGNDTTTLVWDTTARLQGGQLRPAKLSAREVKGLWADLAGADAVRAGQAVWTLAAAPAQALPLLQEQLRPVAPAGKRVVRLIADLDSNTFAVRQKAMNDLEKLREVAEPDLRRAMVKPASLEMRRRLEQLLTPLEKEKFLLSGEELRSLRALEVLGQIGTPETLPLLEGLAQGEPGARLTLEVQAVLKCLRTRANTTKP